MIDSLGRTIDYLRISITDRCNLRCVYCTPRTAVRVSRAEILSYEEILRIVHIMAELGIRKIKVTGGEPLLRRGAAGFIGALKRTGGIEKVTITSNGILLDQHLGDLLRAGIDGINLSLDTLDGETFRRISGICEAGGSADAAFSNIRRFLDRSAHLDIPVKINCVPIRGINDRELAAVAGLAKSGIFVRFIERMPLGCAAAHEGLSEREVFSILETAYGPLEPFLEKPGNGPAVYYSVTGFAGKLGFISPLSRNFCGSCNRLRLGSTGLLRPCIASPGGLDLRSLLRGASGAGEASNGELAQAIKALVLEKPEGHSFGKAAQTAEMFRIGG
ncbi:MAG: GTP 3',8-cyclase MoaA [Treponema sp.]|jgi:cyclic pyranopterin phosphate synthase|nr:GTP 3',8-cyclase MoaA [Treponema sp.]